MNQQPQPKSKSHMLVLVVVIVLAIAAIGVSIWIMRNPGGVETNATEAVNKISITSRGVAPQTINIRKGASITWTNQEATPYRLQITSPNPPEQLQGFGSDEPINQGESYSFTFDATGTFTYADPSNPQTVQGTIIVE